MPRGRPKGSHNLSAYESMKVNRIRESLSQKGISKFDKLPDSQILHDIHLDSDGEIFVKYGLPGTKKRGRHQKIPDEVKILNDIEKNIAALRDSM
jgi:hypothetical protein